MLFAGLCGALPAPQAPLGTGEQKVLVFCFVVREIEGKATQVLLGRMQTPPWQGTTTPGVPTRPLRL